MMGNASFSSGTTSPPIQSRRQVASNQYAADTSKTSKVSPKVWLHAPPPPPPTVSLGQTNAFFIPPMRRGGVLFG